ncbi:MAG TPA: methyltransferase domain-containing protein [Thermoplasmata archaeon]|nr:methyltransferase domain-containing protein [Thermoplasmata archaeon]
MPPPDPAGELEEPSLELLTAAGSVPLGYTRSGAIVFLIARDRAARWPVEALRRGSVALRTSAGLLQGRIALVIDAAERERILASFLAKYGPEGYRRWYEHPARVLRVEIGGASPPVAPEAQYYRWLEAEFDNVAADYDRHITGNRMNRLLRDRSLALLRPTFAGAKRLLEIGCGSGMETLPLLREGHEIVAVDISQEMLDVVRKKARHEGLSERLETVRLPARELPSKVSDLGEASFDGGYSTYGALNCEPDLSALPPALHRLLRPQARLLVGIYNRWCAFEIVGYSLTGQFRRAIGRRTRPVPVGSSRFCVDVFAYSVGDFLNLFRSPFEVERVEGVPVLLPPSDLTQYAEKFSQRFDRLARWDAWIGARFPFSYLGDHFLLLLRRRSILREPLARSAPAEAEGTAG